MTYQQVSRIALVGALLLLASTVAVAQGTPDGETPAEESICDELATATPGLYGLCVAFCEAQDCEPDFAQEDPFEECLPAGPTLLDLYNGLAQASDPPMPCLKIPCPCYDEQDLEAFVPPYRRCRWDRPFFGGTITQSLLDVSPGFFAAIRDDFRPRLTRCIYRAGPPSTVRLFAFLSDQEVAACREVLHAFMDENISQCLTIDDHR